MPQLKNIFSYKKYYVAEGLFLLSWLIYFNYFQEIYKEALEFVTLGAGLEIQLLEIMNYRGQEILTVLLIFFILLTLNGLLVVRGLLQFRRQDKSSKQLLVNTLMIMLPTVLIMLIFLFNKLSIIIFVLEIFSVVLNYIIYSLVNSPMEYEDQDLFEDRGPFSNEEEAILYAESVIKSKGEYFKKRNFALLYTTFVSNNEYFIEIYVEKIQ